MTKPEIYVSTDVETDGPIPGPHSMLSIASVAYCADRTEVGRFSDCLETLPGAGFHPDTFRFWQQNPLAWAAAREDPRPPLEVMVEYCDWLESLPGKPVCVCYPAGFDFTWVYWYLMRFVGRSPFSHAALDVKTLAMAATGQGFRQMNKRNFPRHWLPETKHTHVAIDDAVEQGQLFLNIMDEMRAAKLGM